MKHGPGRTEASRSLCGRSPVGGHRGLAPCNESRSSTLRSKPGVLPGPGAVTERSVVGAEPFPGVRRGWPPKRWDACRAAAALDGASVQRRIHRLVNSVGGGPHPGVATSREEAAMAVDAGQSVAAGPGAAGGAAPGPVAPEAAPPAQPAVRAADLVKTFGPIHAVDGVSFDLAPGRIYGLLGPNGSGKTTLIRLLTGMARATSGRAEVLGVPMPSRAVLARIGYMTQSDGIYPGLTVGENARFFAAVYGVREREPVDDALAVVDLANRVDAVAGTLSGGQRRRLSLACALVHRPPVLFLDEPTVGIDPLLRVEFWTHFRTLAAGGATIVVSSHVMDEADRCDELLFIRSGKVIARGTSAEVRAQAGTADLEQAFLQLGADVEVTR